MVQGRKPRFITFEGPEGGGKTTQASLLAEQLRAAGEMVILTREPGGTELGDRVRELVLTASGVPIGARAETLLYCVARAQLVEQVLKPALAAGGYVIVDRYADSTLAYQAYGRGLDSSGVEAVLDFATTGLRPDLTILLDLPVVQGLQRKRRQAIRGEPAHWNRFETEELAYHERVRQAYLALTAAEPERWRRIDATQPPEAIADQVFQAALGE
jgi:dTMP kinase